MEDRITELEIRLTHIEDTLDVLNETVIDQQKLIDQLQLQVSLLERKLKAVASSNIAPNLRCPPPRSCEENCLAKGSFPKLQLATFFGVRFSFRILFCT